MCSRLESACSRWFPHSYWHCRPAEIHWSRGISGKRRGVRHMERSALSFGSPSGSGGRWWLVGCMIIAFTVLAYPETNGKGSSGACELCETPFHKVIVAPRTLLNGAYSAPLPDLNGYYPEKLVKEPMVVDVLVGSSGIPCYVRAHGNGDARVLSLLEKTAKTWRFKTPKYEGKDICLFSQVPIYAKKVKDKPVLFIPELNDK